MKLFPLFCNHGGELTLHARLDRVMLPAAESVTRNSRVAFAVEVGVVAARHASGATRVAIVRVIVMNALRFVWLPIFWVYHKITPSFLVILVPWISPSTLRSSCNRIFRLNESSQLLDLFRVEVTNQHMK